MATDRIISAPKQYSDRGSQHTLLLARSPPSAHDTHSMGSTKSDSGYDVPETSTSSTSSYSKRSIVSHNDTSDSYTPPEKRHRGSLRLENDLPGSSGCPFPSRKKSCKTEHKFFAHLCKHFERDHHFKRGPQHVAEKKRYEWLALYDVDAMEEPEIGPIFCLGCCKHFSGRLQWRVHQAKQCVTSRLSLAETREAVKNAFINFAPTGLDNSYVVDPEHNTVFNTGPSNLSGFEGVDWSQDTANSVNSPWGAAQEDDWAALVDIHQIGPQDEMFGRPEKVQDDKTQQEDFIRSLGFVGSTNKENRIDEPFPDTCSWIWSLSCTWSHRTPSTGRHVGNILSWLSSEQAEPVLWISGKPGCGKSTLVSHIWRERATHDALEQWSSPQKPIIARYFFDGSDAYFYKNWEIFDTKSLQKEQFLNVTREGMMRSLLQQILHQRRDLASVALTQDVESRFQESTADSTLSWVTLRKAFYSVLDSIGSSKILFVIDGLDEYRSLHSIGDFAYHSRDPGLSQHHLEPQAELDVSSWINHGHLEIARLFRKTLGDRPNIKMCLTSREMPIFETEFSSFTRIRVQEHTGQPIKAYCTSRLAESAPDLKSVHSLDYARVIAAQAQGMFQWARLVVDALITLHACGAHPKELEKAVDGFPARFGGRTGLYANMWRSLNPGDMDEAVWSFQLVSVAKHKRVFLDVLALNLALNDRRRISSTDRCLSVGEEVHPKNIYQLQRERIRLRKRLLAICGGFLEAGDETDDAPDEVRFMHKTALQYLSSEAVQTSHIETARLRFPVEDTALSLNLMSGYVGWLKCRKYILSFCSETQTKSPEIPLLFQRSWNRVVESVLKIATTVNRQIGSYVRTYIDLLDELDDLVKKLDQSLSTDSAHRVPSDEAEKPSPLIWSEMIQRLRNEATRHQSTFKIQDSMEQFGDHNISNKESRYEEG